MMILVSPVHAAEESTITANIPGHTLRAYQIFAGDAIREGEQEPTSGVLSNITWGTGIHEDAFLSELITGIPNWGLTQKSTAEDVAKKISVASSTDVEKFISIALNHLNGDGIKLNNSETSKTTDVAQGYYLIVDKTENLVDGDMLNPAILAVNGDVTVKEKKDTVSVDKTVKNEETDPDFTGSTDTSIGKEVTFKLHTQIVKQTTLDQYDSYFLEFEDTASHG